MRHATSNPAFLSVAPLRLGPSSPHLAARQSLWLGGSAPAVSRATPRRPFTTARQVVAAQQQQQQQHQNQRGSNGERGQRALQRRADWPFGIFRRDPFFTSPFTELDRFWSDFDALAQRQSTYIPALDINETPDAYMVSVELAGVPKENVKVTLKDNVLNIQGEKKWEHEESNPTTHRSERSYGQFSRSVRLPEEVVDQNGIKAQFKDGVLKLVVPKVQRPEAQPKEIPIEAE
ncbi:hypothetical protein CDCA_CDCA10G2868 [Cyanidium caldarium]|uniref:SHSP domain-containing protein n=1 Tax=Cyanidium caldarium TaxID=2771 RepID=A0AAV9IXM0_CYACA|nr:hypothetical protein CDCA_CDCA10G2868 [Cyanidium caldarium]|eukprot:ctg_466.g243